MSTRYALLIRGINVGRNKRLAMADLRELLMSLGCTDVRTHLNSGNAVFTSATPGLEARIEDGLAAELGLGVRCIVRSAEEMRTVIDGHPLRDVATDGSKMLALFLSAAPDPGLLVLHDPIALDPTRAVLGDRVIYQWCPDGVLAAPAVSGFVEKNLEVAVTARNWNTVTKLSELLG